MSADIVHQILVITQRNQWAFIDSWRLRH